MANLRYSEKLRDPRWQKKRLFILERDEWACKKCGARDKTLHVHHKYYIADKEPWDVPDQCLVTLCFECHEEEGQDKDLQEWVIRGFLDFGFFNTDFNEKLVTADTLISKQEVIDLLHLLKDGEAAKRFQKLINELREQEDL